MNASYEVQAGFQPGSIEITSNATGRLSDQRMILTGLFYAAYCLNATAHLPLFKTTLGKSLAAVRNASVLPLSTKFQLEDMLQMIASHNITAKFGYKSDGREDSRYIRRHQPFASCDALRNLEFLPGKIYILSALFIIPNKEHQQLYREMLLSITPNFFISNIAHSVISKLPLNYNCIHDRSEQDRIEDRGKKIDFGAPDNMTYVASGNDHATGLQYRKIYNLQFDPDTHALIDQLICINSFNFYADPRSGFSSYIIYRRFEKGLHNQTYLLATRKLVHYYDIPFIYSSKNGYVSNPGF